jgi:hypothetical protein
LTEPEQPREEEPEQPRTEPSIPVEAEEWLGARRATGSRRTSWLRFLAPYILFGVAVAIFLLIRLFQGPPAPPQPPPASATLTKVAGYIGTARTELQWTREPIGTSPAASSHSTATAVARAHSASALSTALVAAHMAPPTQTARAQAAETARAAADAKVGVLTTQATPVFGPTGGTLLQTQPDRPACSSAGTSLRNFIAGATFRNPSAPADPWSYGLTFSNSGDTSEYRLILSSEGTWALNLHSDAYDVTNTDDTALLDITPGASNALKLYATDDAIQLYINNQSVDTLDLQLFFDMGQSPTALHNISICTGIDDRTTPTAQPKPTTYENFTVWSLP